MRPRPANTGRVAGVAGCRRSRPAQRCLRWPIDVRHGGSTRSARTWSCCDESHRGRQSGRRAVPIRQGHRGSKIVIGYDARRNSQAFAELTAAIAAAGGLTAEVLPRRLPTPVLAYAIKARGADAGVVVTASHNPPEDNGYKVYLGDGMQIVSPADAEISARIAAQPSYNQIPSPITGSRWTRASSSSTSTGPCRWLIPRRQATRGSPSSTQQCTVSVGPLRGRVPATGVYRPHTGGRAVRTRCSVPHSGFPQSRGTRSDGSRARRRSRRGCGLDHRKRPGR